MHAKHDTATPVYDTPLAKGLKLEETESTEYVELTLLKDGGIPEHSLDMPVTFYVAEGCGMLAVDGRPFKVGKGDLVRSKAGSTRELTNTGNGELRVLVIKHKL